MLADFIPLALRPGCPILSQPSPFVINPNLDKTAIAAALASQRRVQIRNFLSNEKASDLYRCLSQEIEWNTIFSDGDEKVHAMHPTQVTAMNNKQKEWLAEFVTQKARHDFQFIYHNYPVWDLWKKNISPDHELKRFVEFLNDEPFLSFIRSISGIASIGQADAQGTLFKPQHFLTRHTDRDHSYKGRRMAYVMNMTPRWRAEWGGILEFLDADGNVEAGFTPSFNVLNLFYVPCWHHVSYVAPFADGGRYSITGWLRDPT
jgi:SM-20-related protein